MLNLLRSLIFTAVSTCLLLPVASLATAGGPLTPLQIEAQSNVFMVITPQARGSATYIGGGLFVSAWHVVDGLPEGFTFLLYNPTTGRSHQVKVLKADATWDLVLISTKSVHVVPKGVSVAGRDVGPGDSLFMCGFGNGFAQRPPLEEKRIFSGKFESFSGRPGYFKKHWYVIDPLAGDKPAIPGDSGGGVFIVIRNQVYLVGPLWGTSADPNNPYTIASNNSILRELLLR